MPIPFSSLSAESVLGRVLRAPLALIPDGMTVRILQGPLRGKKWIAGSSDHGCWLGSYEHAKQARLNDRLKRGGVMWDIGANVGFYTLLASHRAGPTGRVVAFEPLPENLVYLRRHLGMNGCRNVLVLDLAVSDHDGASLFKRGGSSSSGGIAEGGDVPVTVAALDHLWESGQIGSPDMIKMDIEGAEYQALQGATKVLASCAPVIFLATHGARVHKDCCDLLLRAGYKLESLLPGVSIQTSNELIAVRDGP